MFALTWRCDGSEGIKWFLRGIRIDGSFYGEIRYQSVDVARRKATCVNGSLTAPECLQFAKLVKTIRHAVPPVQPGPHFGALFEWGPQGLSDPQRLYEYRIGDETHSASARAFVTLVGLLKPSMRSFYPKIDDTSSSD